jgi:predicted aspartyl protease
MADFTYCVEKRLIIVPVRIYSSTHYIEENFIFDTGASYTIIDYRLAKSLGYTKSGSSAPSRISSVVGEEMGFRTQIEGIEAFGKRIAPFEIACHSLFEQGVSGLLGMTFLENINFCIFPSEKIIRVQ